MNQLHTFVRFTGALLLLSGILFTQAQTASAQATNEYEDQVILQLNAMADVLAESDFTSTHDYVVEELNGNAEDAFSVTLDEGVTYLIASVCDEDCSDVDIKLYDENDNLISLDESTDDVPIAEVTPAWTGEFTIEVHMYECTADPCFYGIGVFGN